MARQVKVGWKGYYFDPDGNKQWCDGVEAVISEAEWGRICSNTVTYTPQLLRRLISGFVKPENEATSPWFIEEVSDDPESPKKEKKVKEKGSSKKPSTLTGWIFYIIWWLIKLPFKIIWWLFK